ncbi:MAG: efflux RND transporter permease subunit [Gammaproteobacteria bacterium]|nr:efflux RND transporter permease subunit [Gammaproteobacteria bacterium]
MNTPNLSSWALHHPSMIYYLMIVLLLGGIMAFNGLGQAEDPEFTIKTMVVRTLWPGATALEVEKQLTDRLEMKLQETPWLDYLSSYSKPGESMIFINLEPGTPASEVPATWYQVRKKLDDIRDTLPKSARGPYPNDEFGDTFGTIYAFTTDGVNHALLRNYVDNVRQELLQIDAVEKVDLIGVQDEKIFIEFSNVKLAALGLNPLLIIDTLQAQNFITPSGVIETKSDEIHLRVDGLKSVAAIREIGIRANDRIFRLGDIAQVQRDYLDPPQFKMRFQGQEALGLAVSMREGGNVLALGEALDSTMAHIEANLPIGIDLHKVADQPTVVETSINEFLKVLAEAVGIVLLVSFISLGLRTGLVVALSIPLVLAATFLGMKLVGVDLQRISLGALIIALGLLVDDAMIAIEMMAVKLEQGWDRFKAASFAYSNTAFPMLTGTLITVVGFSPVSFAESGAGEYTRSIFIVVGIALLISWLVAVLFIPFLGYRLLPTPSSKHVESDLYQRPFYRLFRRLVGWSVRWRWLVIVFTLGIFAASLFGFKYVDQNFFPTSNRPELIVDLWLPQGASFVAAEARSKQLEELLDKDPEISSYTGYIGGGSPRFYLPLGQELRHKNLAQYVVLTTGPTARDGVKERLKQATDLLFPDLRVRIQPLFNGPPVNYPVQFRVIGHDNTMIRDIATQVATVMADDPATRNVHFDWNEMSKVVQLEIDQDKARVLGISSQELALMLNAALDGHSITRFREGNRSIELLARAEEKERVALENVGDLNIDTPSGESIPMNQLVKLNYGLEEGIIWRRNSLPTITVRADVVSGTQAPDISHRIDPLLHNLRADLPPGYRIEMGGTAEASAENEEPIAAAMPIMILAVFTLLMIQLQNFQRSLLVMLTAPLGLIGVVAALLIFKAPFGFVSTLGVIALFGMIIRNSVILVHQIEQNRADGHDLYTAIVESTVHRFRPIALTAAAAVLAMIPLSRSIFWGPMAMTIMGGLVVATVLTLLFLPALYAAWFRAPKNSD